MPSDADSATPPSGSTSEDSAHTYFHNSDPVALAEAANLGDGGPEEVVQVQGFYRQVLEFVDDVAWAEDPVGPLGNHWRGVGNGQSTNYLINIADMLQRLAGNVSPGVGRTIVQRIRSLLRPVDDHRYEEALAELEVGSVLALRMTPVLLEPLVPSDWKPSHGNQPMSPDYGVRMPEGLVTIEVTVWHWEAYAAWQRMSNMISTTLSARMRKRDVVRNIRVELPIGSPKDLVSTLWSHEFCDMVCNSESGQITTTPDAAERPIRATWRPMLHFADDSNIDWDAVDANGGLPFTSGPSIGHAFGYSVNPCFNDDDRAAAFESLRKSIDRKKRQHDPASPHFLALASTAPQISTGSGEFTDTWDLLGLMIEKRMWANPRYAWLSGVLHHRPNRMALKSDTIYTLEYNPVVPGRELFGVSPNRGVTDGGHLGGDPVLEEGEVAVTRGNQLVVLEDAPQVNCAAIIADAVEALVGHRNLAGCQLAQQLSHLGRSFPGVNAFGAVHGAEDAHQCVHGGRIGGIVEKQRGEVVAECAACADAAPVMLGFGAAPGAVEVGVNAGAVDAGS